MRSRSMPAPTSFGSGHSENDGSVTGIFSTVREATLTKDAAAAARSTVADEAAACVVLRSIICKG